MQQGAEQLYSLEKKILKKYLQTLFCHGKKNQKTYSLCLH